MRYGRRGERAGGFTLVELLVVIVIVILVSAVALPTIIPALTNRQVGEGARILQAALAGARDAAIRANAPRGIRLIPDTMLSPAGTFAPLAQSLVGTGAILTSSRIIYIEPAPDIAASPQQQLKFANYKLSPFTPLSGNTVSYTSAWTNGNNPGYPPIFPFPFPDDSNFSAGGTANCSSGTSRGVYPYFLGDPTNGGAGSPAFYNNKGNAVLMVTEAKFVNNDPSAAPNAPADWFWNVRIGDRLRIGDSGHYYTVVGPMTVPNPEFYVNDGPPATSSLYEQYSVTIGANPAKTYTSGVDFPAPQFLFLVNGIDDDSDGYVDNGVNGVNENLNYYSGGAYSTNPANLAAIDDIFEWGYNNTNVTPNLFTYYEVETWQGVHASRSTGSSTYSYTITRRPVPVPGAQEVPLPGGAVIDLTTWDTTRERSRLPVDPNNGYVDIMMNQSGQVIPTTAYSSPASMSMASVFYHFWVTDRNDILPINTQSSGYLPKLPIPDDPSIVLPTPDTRHLKKDRALVTLFTRTGQVVSNSIENFDFSHAYQANKGPAGGSAYDVNMPFYQAEQGIREAK